MALEWGDKVRVLTGPNGGTEGWITGLDKSEPYNPLLGVEREDGSVVKVPWDGEKRVLKIPDPEAEAQRRPPTTPATRRAGPRTQPAAPRRTTLTTRTARRGTATTGGPTGSSTPASWTRPGLAPHEAPDVPPGNPAQ